MLPSISHSTETYKAWSYLYYKACLFVSGSKFVDTCTIQLNGLYVRVHVIFAINGGCTTNIFTCASDISVFRPLPGPGPGSSWAIFSSVAIHLYFPRTFPSTRSELRWTDGRTKDWGALIKRNWYTGCESCWLSNVTRGTHSQRRCE